MSIMSTNMAAELDPLGTYEYASYNNYGNIDAKHDQLQYGLNLQTPLQNPYYNPINELINNTIQNYNNTQEDAKCEDNAPPEEPDIKPDLNTLKQKQRKKKNFLSEKIKDNDFKFYGCAICEISFKELHELDTHVTTHKGRLTSYDLRKKNQLKKKKLKKEKRKLKKLEKNVKAEEQIEIKPEDGYIGSEKAADFDNNAQYYQKDQNANQNVPINDQSQLPNTSASETQDSKDKKQSETDDSILNKLYKCFGCKKQFSLSYYLKLHVRSHTDEKPYTCAECGQSFITASKLGRHTKRTHLAVRFQCRICHYTFSRFEQLTKHFDKKHEADKIEGEPYDYNAILPYLRELEEQLREKEEEKKPKTEHVWEDGWAGGDPAPEPWGGGEHALLQPPGDAAPPPDIMPKRETDDNLVIEFEKNGILVEELKVPLDSPQQIEVEVKLEENKEDVKSEGGFSNDDHRDHDDDDKDDVKDELMSDDDYFPSNTWISPPKMDDAPPSPSKPSKKKQPTPTKCKICEKMIKSASYMRVHMRTHTGDKPYKCYVCGRGFITASKMHRHVLTHDDSWTGGEGEEQIKKEDVSVKAEGGDEPDTGDDQKKKDKKQKKTKPKVPKKAEDKSKPKDRRRMHSCEYCQKRFLHSETLRVHKMSHAGEAVQRQCYYCLVRVPDAAELKEHEGSHTGPKPFVCTVCGKCYKKRESMVYHRKQHENGKLYICDICSKTFSAEFKLQRHIVSHSTDRFVLRYECPVCAHMFHTKYHIQMHLATHQKEGIIQEENRNDVLAMVLQNARRIPKQPDAPGNLTDMIPADERSRVCNICGEVFHHFYYLEEHLKSHGSRIAIEDANQAEEKKHICQVCNKGFKLHYYLKLHSYTHTKEKPYICQQCGKGFITKGKLKRHLETHSGLKKYQCHICYKFFTRPSYLRIHIRTIHANTECGFRNFKDFSSSLGMSM